MRGITRSAPALQAPSAGTEPRRSLCTIGAHDRGARPGRTTGAHDRGARPGRTTGAPHESSPARGRWLALARRRGRQAQPRFRCPPPPTLRATSPWRGRIAKSQCHSACRSAWRLRWSGAPRDGRTAATTPPVRSRQSHESSPARGRWLALARRRGRQAQPRFRCPPPPTLRATSPLRGRIAKSSQRFPIRVALATARSTAGRTNGSNHPARSLSAIWRTTPAMPIGRTRRRAKSSCQRAAASGPPPA